MSKQCSVCGLNKPETSYYKRQASPDGLDYTCKICRSVFSKQQNLSHPNKSQSGHQTEQAVINKLLSNGIYAVPGKTTQFSRIDVVAWGCVKIEVKSGYMSNDKTIRFGLKSVSKQNHSGLKNSDIIVLYYDGGDEESFWVFPANHRIFFKPNGKNKTAISFTWNSVKNDRRAIPPSAIKKHHNNWDLIEEKRIEYASRITINPDVQCVTDKKDLIYSTPKTMNMF